jgi:hypothetical protein
MEVTIAQHSETLMETGFSKKMFAGPGRCNLGSLEQLLVIGVTAAALVVIGVMAAGVLAFDLLYAFFAMDPIRGADADYLYVVYS